MKKPMQRCAAADLVLLLMIFPLVVMGLVQGQTSTTIGAYTLTVGRASVKPSIDGVWGYGEWSDSNQTQLTYFYNRTNNLGRAYLRMKYDEKNFYLLFDVISDTGITSPNRTQFTLMSFDTNNDGFSVQNDTLNDFFIAFTVNGTRVALNWFGRRPSFTGEILAGQSLSPSPNLEAPHRIYEISIPTSLVLRENLTTIGFNACTDDSYGNTMCLTDPANPPYQVELTFSNIALPEFQNITILLPALVTLAVLTIHRQSRRKQALR